MDWIKLAVNTFDDAAIKIIESMPDYDSILVIWLKLLCLAGKGNSGVLKLKDKVPYTDEMLASAFNRPIATVRLAMQTFEALGMVENFGGVYAICAWDNWQGSEKIERYKAENAKRQKRYRERQKALALGDGTDSNVTHNVTVTRQIKDKDKDKDIYINQFEQIWSDYPRKEEKQKAFKAFKSAIKSGVSPDTIHAKVLEYANQVKGKERQYIAQGGTWFFNRRWEDEYSPIQTIDADFQSLIDAQEEWGNNA